jgi:hypothetical protein
LAVWKHRNYSPLNWKLSDTDNLNSVECSNKSRSEKGLWAPKIADKYWTKARSSGLHKEPCWVTLDKTFQRFRDLTSGFPTQGPRKARWDKTFSEREALENKETADKYPSSKRQLDSKADEHCVVCHCTLEKVR